jgi:RHS repeat-associated protein
LYGLGRIAERQGAASEYYLGDALGSVRQLTNDGGTVTLARNYEPFGRTSQSIGTAQTDYGFTGEFTDASGLIHLRARYYQSLTGRFTTRDSFEGDVNTPASLNRFNYAHSNPVLYTDPTGHFAQIIAGAALGGFIGLIGGKVFAELTYGWAIQGECGCEMQMWALSVGHQWTDQAARQSAVIGAVAGAVASTGPVGVIVVGTFGVTTSAMDALRTGYQVVAQGGFDNCTLLRFVTDVVGYIGSAAAISAGANTLIDSTIPQLTRTAVINKLNQVAGTEIDKLVSISGRESAIGFKGSLARGTVGNPKKATFRHPVDLNDFDIDAFIISDDLANQFPGSGFRHGEAIPELNVIQNRIETKLRRLPEFSGLRSYESFEFRIWRWSEVSSPKFNLDGTEVFWYGGFR